MKTNKQSREAASTRDTTDLIAVMTFQVQSALKKAQAELDQPNRKIDFHKVFSSTALALDLLAPLGSLQDELQSDTTKARA
jgi:hypothetical protein